MKKLLSILSVLTAMAMLAGCDKETNPIDSSPTKKPTAPQVSMTGPNINSTNPYALQAQTFAQTFNGYTQFFSIFASLNGEQNDNTWTYTYNFNTITETITVTQQGDGSYTWVVIFNGTEGNVTYTNWKAMEGTSSADSKSGNWKIYAENSTQLEVELAWNTDAQGNETGMLKAYTNGILNEQIDIINNIDSTGSMKMYQKKNASNDLFLNIEITWIANGTGAYTLYDESGNVINSGEFGDNSPKKPTAPQVSMTGPNTNSTNQYAVQAQSFAMMFNGYTQFFTAFASMEGEQNGNTWTYTYDFGTMSEIVTVTQLTDGSYTWSVVFNGTDGSTTYSNWKAMEGTSSADSKSGSWKIYAENSTQLEAELAWNTDAQGNETGMLKAYTNGVLNEQLDIVNNIDGSGSMKMYQKKNASNDLFLNIEITWIANGTGAYTLYDENGGVLESGTF